jgi:hypothetical protein
MFGSVSIDQEMLGRAVKVLTPCQQTQLRKKIDRHGW